MHNTLIFLNIPQTAGTAFRSILSRNYGNRELFSVASDSEGNPDYSDLQGLTIDKKRELKVLVGRLQYGVHEYLPQQCSYVSVLSDPVQRVISSFLHAQRKNQAYAKPSLAEYLNKNKKQRLFNFQTRILAGDWSATETTEVMLEKAISNISTHFALVGLTDLFDETALLASRMFHWTEPLYINKNIANAGLQEFDEETIHVVKSGNRLDLMLCDFVKDKLTDMVRSLGATFADDLARFKQRNAQFSIEKRARLQQDPSSAATIKSRGSSPPISLSRNRKHSSQKVSANIEEGLLSFVNHPLHNNGVVSINFTESSEEKTIIVTGAPRGGTSMIAGSLRHFGIFMGKINNNITYEDSGLIDAVAKKDIAAIRKVIEQRNADYKVWGWKQPTSFDFFSKNVVPLLRNPCFVIIFRDVLAVAKRNSLSAMVETVRSMKATLELYLSIVHWIEKTDFPCLLVSYEKAINDKLNFATCLGEFCGINDRSLIQSATDFIQPSPKYYLDNARITQSVGQVDTISPKQVTGWAMVKKRPETAAEVLLEVNGSIIMSAKADKFRRDLLDKGIHPTGNCGFIFEFTQDMRFDPDDKIDVRVAGDLKYLPKA